VHTHHRIFQNLFTDWFADVQVKVVLTRGEDFLDVTFVSTDVVVVVSERQVDVLTNNPTTELSDGFKPTKRPVTQVNQDIVLTNQLVDTVYQRIVHMVQGLIVTGQIIGTHPICGRTTNVPVVIVSV
jgi:hypothetical protein